MNAIQLYTLRDIGGSIEGLLERVAEAGFDGVEYAYRVPKADLEVVRATLAETGLSVPGAHVPITDLETDLEETVDLYQALECERLVIPFIEDADFDSRDAVEETARRLDTLAERLAKYNYPLLYHNHSVEFTTLGDDTAFEVLAAETESVDFEVDVGLAAKAGIDPVDLLERYADRIKLLHCTDATFDTDEVSHTSFGTGDVEYEPIFEAAEAAGIDWYIYENGSTDAQRAELENAKARFLDR